MYLSKLEIYGFKSFTDKVVFTFNGGVTAIVGPNGCGKSNVVDAIRWVLGEQKTSVLRLEQMENIIFNGSAKRKPLSMAEVSITIENTKNILPSEYSEVQVSRRLFRNGESQYFINKVKCRRRDIIELFMDTGLGPDSYSVIELKMVESILNGKIEDRRSLFEEAAGINKYKTRLKEAESKLDSVQQDLIRLMDLKAELEKNVASLARQASKTKRYNKLIEELKILETKCILFDYSKYVNKAYEIEESININAKELNEIKNSYDDLHNEHKNLQAQKNLKENELRQAKDIEINLLDKYHTLVRDNAVLEEKQKNLLDLEEKIKYEIEENDKKKIYFTQQLEDLEIKQAQLNSQYQEFKVNLEKHKEELRSFENDWKTLKDKVSDYFNELAIAKNQSKHFEDELNKLRLRKELLINKQQTENENLKNLEKEIENLKSALNNEIEIKRIFENDIETKKTEINKSISEREFIKGEIDKLKDSLSKINLNIGNLQTKLDFLTGLEIFRGSVRFLKNNRDWNESVEKITLGELIGIDEEYQVAYSVALGEYIDYFLLDNEDKAIKAIEILQQMNKGRAGFICAKNNVLFDVEIPNLPASENIIGWASELPRVDEDMRKLLRILLPKTLITQKMKLSEASELFRTGLVDTIIMLDGTTINKNGIIAGGKGQNNISSSIALKERVARIRQEVDKLSGEKHLIETKIENYKTQFSNISTHISSIQNELISAGKSLDQCKHKISDFNFRIQSNIDKINFTKQNIRRFDDEINEIEVRIGEYEENIININKNIEDEQLNYEISNAELEDLEAQIANKQVMVEEFEQKFLEMQLELSSINNEINSLKGNVNQIEELKKSQILQLEQIAKTLVDINCKKEEYFIEITNINDQINESKHNIDIISNQLNSINSQLEISENEIQIITNKIDSLKQKIHQAEISLTEYKSYLNNLKTKALELYGFEPDDIQTDVETNFSIDDAKKTIQMIKEKLASLGNVNFLALEEFEKENERLRFLTDQINDLTSSEKTLNETIDEINVTATERFLETFEKIRVNFSKLYKVLFGENGIADLKLVGDNPLEAAIEIISIPPGKKPHSIEQISTGEKTLTAIALLFAIYLVKPSPFCILDEVDAPLDDANIDKFLNLIKEFSKETQFIIVTHNKRTMESANTLYGITMAEEGVSSVVSVKLQNEDIVKN